MTLDEPQQQKELVPDTGQFPSELEFSIGGYMGASYAVNLKEKAIEYTWHGARSKRRGTERIVPSADRWNTFRDELDRLGVWGWAERYSDPAVVDGTNWSVAIHWGDRRIESGGSNAFPGRFEDVLTAVSGLIGGRVFR